MREELLQEARFGQRLQYLTSKRYIVAIEMLLFLFQLFLHLYTYMDPAVRTLLVLIGLLRIMTELHNYHVWAGEVGMKDGWLYLWPFK